MQPTGPGLRQAVPRVLCDGTLCMACVLTVPITPQSAPPPLCPSGRTPDLKALLNVVDNARSFIYVAVMNYLPTMEFSHPHRYGRPTDRAWGRDLPQAEEAEGEGGMRPECRQGDQSKGKPQGEAEETRGSRDRKG